MDIQVYLPDRETQLKTIETDTRIENLLGRLETLRTGLWSKPRAWKDVERELQSVNNEATFTDWLDTLPFPLASILWTYHTIGNDFQRRYERLLQFFEAQAEFLAAALIAGFQNDSDWLPRKKAEIRSTLNGHSLDLGTFGIWVRIVENLAKEARAYLNGSAEDKIRCYSLFKTTDHETLSMLFSGEIVSVLQHANSLRNDWSGHTGLVGSADARLRHAVLESLLSKVRRVYGTHWQSYRLVKAGKSGRKDGIYRHDVELIMGTRTPFQPDEVITEESMEMDDLYLLAIGERQPLKLTPLIKILPSPKTAANACYFYNRAENGERLRFVSYHYELDAELIDAFPDTRAALRSITEITDIPDILK